MGKSLSEDLRWRIIYCQAEGLTQNEIAKRMYVSESTVYKVCRIFKKWGCVKDPFVGKVEGEKYYQDKICRYWKAWLKKSRWYLDELVHEMEQRIGKLVSIPTLWRSLKFCGITRKKIQKASKERSDILRGVYLYNIGMNYTAEQLIFIDESAKDERTLTRLYGYSSINTRAKKSVVFVRGKRYTILPALSLEGFIAVDIMEGSCDKERFKTFVLTQLVNNLYLYHYLEFFINNIHLFSIRYLK
ncbi:hypothetical protein RclHR1_01040027 [Rhizophagus clarus]|uniref:Uncharacterized protein n=1 Tax=Rhizophagus clarus TaxID=94130 RepID=A0A2Z6Q618_9GLOM|nr:hypothetical protein RclHR1_01040027 [Rhizophagus clarus]